MIIIDNQLVGEITTEELSGMLCGIAIATKESGNELVANILLLAAGRLREFGDKHK